MSQRIGDLVVAAGIMSRDKLEALLATKPPAGARLLGRIHALGLATERALASVLANHAGVPVVVLGESPIDLAALRAFPERILRDHLILPVSIDAGHINVISAEPEAPEIVHSLALLSGRRVTWFLGIHGAVTEHLERALQAAAAGDTALKPTVGAGRGLALALPPTPEDMRLAGFAEMLVEEGFDATIITRANRVAGLAPLKEWPMMVPDARPDVVIAPVQAPPPGQRIALVVDDDKGIRDLVKRTLEHDDYSVFAAADGDECIKLLRVIYPDVIVLDAMMPGLHGFEILAALRQSQTFKDVPVIVCSAIYADWAQARAIQETHGADGFLPKPFGLAELR
ncbi:MAG TPA: response regulator, partial [Myxococcota bacterium]